MLNKKFILIVLSLAAAVILAILFIPKSTPQQNYEQKLLLANQIQKAVNRLMFDLQNVKGTTLKDVPADGKWHSRLSFSKVNEGAIEYSLNQNHLIRTANGKSEDIASNIAAIRMRRMVKNPDILEVRLEARNKMALASNFKIRLSK